MPLPLAPAPGLCKRGMAGAPAGRTVRVDRRGFAAGRAAAFHRGASRWWNRTLVHPGRPPRLARPAVNSGRPAAAPRGPGRVAAVAAHLPDRHGSRLRGPSRRLIGRVAPTRPAVKAATARIAGRHRRAGCRAGLLRSVRAVKRRAPLRLELNPLNYPHHPSGSPPRTFQTTGDRRVPVWLQV